MTRPDGRVVAVTGAGSGIGRAVALRLARDGSALALLGRTRERLDAVAEEVRAAGGRALAVPADVTDRAALRDAFARLARELGPPHALVANAGCVGSNGPDDDAHWDAVVRTNLDGTYFSIRAFQAVMAPGPEPRHVVVMSSVVARFGVPGVSAYSAAKAGQLGLVRSLAAELAPAGVRVNAVCPGWVETRMADQRLGDMAAEAGRTPDAVRAEQLAAVPLGRMSPPEEIAGVVAFLLSPDGAAFTGQALDPNNGAWMG